MVSGAPDVNKGCGRQTRPKVGWKRLLSSVGSGGQNRKKLQGIERKKKKPQFNAEFKVMMEYHTLSDGVANEVM